jgi:hypothetical protein
VARNRRAIDRVQIRHTAFTSDCSLSHLYAKHVAVGKQMRIGARRLGNWATRQLGDQATGQRGTEEGRSHAEPPNCPFARLPDRRSSAQVTTTPRSTSATPPTAFYSSRIMDVDANTVRAKSQELTLSASAEYRAPRTESQWPREQRQTVT